MKKTALILLPVICLMTVAASNAPPEPDGRVNKYVTRCELLMNAMDYVGVSSPRDALSVWADGLMSRSAAIQFSVMSARLKADYAARLDELDSNWVTGMSSPWVDRYKITKLHKRGNSANAEVTVETMTSAGPYETYRASLTLVREDRFWRIDSISADEGLYPYTLYGG